MSHHPTTFGGEAATDEAAWGGVGWDDYAALHRRDGGGLLHDFKSIRRGTFAELLRAFANLPISERAGYMIEKAGDRQYQPHEIMALLRRPDFPRDAG